jgi:hypothetical protein
MKHKKFFLLVFPEIRDGALLSMNNIYKVLLNILAEYRILVIPVYSLFYLKK